MILRVETLKHLPKTRSMTDKTHMFVSQNSSRTRNEDILSSIPECCPEKVDSRDSRKVN